MKWEPAVGAFYEHLTGQGKPKMVAVVAVMWKLLHAIYGMPWAREQFRRLEILPDPRTDPLTFKRALNGQT